jgi:hypothetical protein
MTTIVEKTYLFFGNNVRQVLKIDSHSLIGGKCMCGCMNVRVQPPPYNQLLGFKQKRKKYSRNSKD